MRYNVHDFVATLASSLDVPGPVVEIGALQVPGQESIANLRPLFPGKKYTGCDMRHGTGVDRIEDVEAGLSFKDGSVGTLLSLDTLEHVFDVLAAFREFRRVLKPGGILAISSVMLFPIHSYPYDYWRFTPECFSRLLSGFDRHHVFADGEPDLPHTIYGLAALEPVPDGFDRMASRLMEYVRNTPQDGRGCGWQPSHPWPGRGGAASLADVQRLEGAVAEMGRHLALLTEALDRARS
jgi:SAM-dependent methyltransferase